MNISARASSLFAVGAAIGAVIAGGPLTSRAEAVTAGEAVALLNAQRARNGLPANVIERPEWSAACAKHNWYQERSGHFGHNEDPSSPYFTEEGAWAGRSAVLSRGDDGWPAESPWAHAPIHLHQLLHPALLETGIDVTPTRYACAITWPGYRKSNQPVDGYAIYSYPGNSTTGVEPAIRAAESPRTPGDLVGLPQPTVTGPYLYLFLDGPFWDVLDAKVLAASLSSPTGPVDIRVIDSTHPGIAGSIRSGGFIIPVQPLQPFTSYRASATFQTPDTTITHDFTFTTGDVSIDSDGTGAAQRGKRRTRGKRRKAARLRLRAWRKDKRRVMASVRFQRGHGGRLKAFAKCLDRRSARIRLGLVRRGRASALFVGRVRPCRRTVVFARMTWSAGYKSGSARRIASASR